MFAFVGVCLVVLILRKKYPNAERTFRCPWVPVVPILGIGMCLLLMFSLPTVTWWRLIASLAIGIIVYLAARPRTQAIGLGS